MINISENNKVLIIYYLAIKVLHHKELISHSNDHFSYDLPPRMIICLNNRQKIV